MWGKVWQEEGCSVLTLSLVVNVWIHGDSCPSLRYGVVNRVRRLVICYSASALTVQRQQSDVNRRTIEYNKAWRLSYWSLLRYSLSSQAIIYKDPVSVVWGLFLPVRVVHLSLYGGKHKTGLRLVHLSLVIHLSASTRSPLKYLIRRQSIPKGSCQVFCQAIHLFFY